MSELPLTCDNLDECCTNHDELKVSNGYKGILKSIRLFTTNKNKYFVKKK